MKKKGYFKVTSCCNKITIKDYCETCNSDKKESIIGKKVNISGKEVHLKGRHNMFQFKCQNCGKCCRGSKAPLSPYDVLILSKRWNISMKQFLKKYVLFVKQEDKFMQGYLNTTPACPFLSENKCSIYSDRPFVCRMFPLGTHTERNELYFFYHNKLPIHSNTSVKQTIDAYLKRNMDEEQLEIQKEWAKFKFVLTYLKLPLENQKFSTTLTQILYRFDEPEVISKIEEYTGPMSQDPTEQFYQVIRFIEKHILMPTVKTIYNQQHKSEQKRTSIISISA